ncbi:WhiB family transcriptional regulator [Streptomyces sp. NPDC098781]|uniref:WhiB family transcriptional regulator n=1 Tax=Streptomyces sp. NPDC098781 TaxID=3366097 RepID=UPI003829298B
MRIVSPIVPMPPTTGTEPCVNADCFFPEDYSPTGAEVVAAKAMCGKCPIIQLCLIWSLAHPVLAEEGIWGATTPGQRRTLRHELRHRLGIEGMEKGLRSAYERAMTEHRAAA